MTTFENREHEVNDENLHAEEHAYAENAGHVSGTENTHRPIPEALGEHRDGESVGEWLRNDLEQTKQDLHMGGHKDETR